MMPRDSVYGDWPASGEIDIVESKGNPVQHVNDETRNTVRSSLHWGPASGLDRYSKTTDVVKRELTYVGSVFASWLPLSSHPRIPDYPFD